MFKALSRALSALTLTVLWPIAGHAGLVTGHWDPAFGPFLPGLSWQVRTEMLVPNTCAAQADGVYSTASTACDRNNITVQNVWLRLFNTGAADPNDFFGSNPGNSAVWDMQGLPGVGYGVSQVRVENGQVVGFEAGRIDLIFSTTAPAVLTPVYAQSLVCVGSGSGCTNASWPSAAAGNLFGLVFGVNGPTLECLDCRQSLIEEGGPESVYASTENLSQFLVTYNSNDTSAPKFTDADGNALGARLDSRGDYLGQSRSVAGALLVPEPGSLALVMAAVLALGTTRARTRRRG